MPRTSFLFWNINRKPLTRLIGEIARTHQVDVLMLAECEIKPVILETELSLVAAEYEHAFSINRRVAIFTRFPAKLLAPIYEDTLLSMFKLGLPDRPQILLAAVHMPSRLYWSGASLDTQCVLMADRIRKEEQRAGHARTILVGDFNANPFDNGMVSAGGFHAVMTRLIAAAGSRQIQRQDYPYFYNPMWSRLGDLSTGPPGTYYYDRAEHVTHFWNTFDQVLLRPDLAAGFTGDDLEVLTSTGPTLLVQGNGRPDARSASDHLPLLFRLEL